MARKICLGGTFNIIHEGHMTLLRKAFESGDDIYIGLTTDKMASRSRKVPLQSYETRMENLSSALSQISGQDKFSIFPLDDPVGRAGTGDFDAIVVSTETQRGAEKINEVRERNGLKPLEIIIIEMVLASDGKPISSTRVLKGVIGPKGEVKNS